MLSDKIWITRKARIYAEKRLRKRYLFSELIMVLYSALLVFLSIWTLVHPNPNLSMLSVFGSVVVLVSSVFLSSQRYSERALSMRSCYIKLDELYSKVKRMEEGKDLSQLAYLESEYSSVLENVENHTDYDYLCLRYSLRNTQETTLPEFRLPDYIAFFLAKGLRLLLMALLLILPIVLPIFLPYPWSS